MITEQDIKQKYSRLEKLKKKSEEPYKNVKKEDKKRVGSRTRSASKGPIVKQNPERQKVSSRPSTSVNTAMPISTTDTRGRSKDIVNQSTMKTDTSGLKTKKTS